MSYSQSQRDKSWPYYSYVHQSNQDYSNVVGYQDQNSYSQIAPTGGSTNQLNKPFHQRNVAFMNHELNVPLISHYQPDAYDGVTPNSNTNNNGSSFQQNPWTNYQYCNAPPPNYWAPGCLNYPPPQLPVAGLIPQVGLVEGPETKSPVKVAEGMKVKKPVIMVGKRRGGRVLPTGVVKKRAENNTNKNVAQGGNSFMAYTAEVRRYTERLCEEDPSCNRSLVK